MKTHGIGNEIHWMNIAFRIELIFPHKFGSYFLKIWALQSALFNKFVVKTFTIIKWICIVINMASVESWPRAGHAWVEQWIAIFCDDWFCGS